MHVVISRDSRCAIVVSEAPDKVAMLRLDEGNTVVLNLHPIVWCEVASTGEQIYDPDKFRDNMLKWQFAEFWKPLQVKGGGLYSVQEAARKFLRGVSPKIIPEFGNGAIETLVECLPHGDVHLFTAAGGFLGRFSAVEDATLIARAIRERGVIVESLADLKKLPVGDLAIVQTALDPERKWAAAPNAKQYQEIYEMTKKAAKKTAKKVAKVNASRKRADGPVAKARAMFESMRGKSRSEMIAACIAAGVNKSTANTQYGNWKNETGYKAPEKKEEKKSSKDKSAAKKSAAKPAAKKSAKKKAAAKKRTPAAPATTDSTTDDAGDSTEQQETAADPSSAVADSQPAGSGTGGADTGALDNAG